MGFLVESGFDINTLKQVSGTTFAMQEFLALNVNQEDPTIYGTIQMENPLFKKILTNIQRFLANYIDILDRKDANAFADIMVTNREFLNQDPLSAEAYVILYQLWNISSEKLAALQVQFTYVLEVSDVDLPDCRFFSNRRVKKLSAEEGRKDTRYDAELPHAERDELKVPCASSPAKLEHCNVVPEGNCCSHNFNNAISRGKI